jgi:hypothetical protein
MKTPLIPSLFPGALLRCRQSLRVYETRRVAPLRSSNHPLDSPRGEQRTIHRLDSCWVRLFRLSFGQERCGAGLIRSRRARAVRFFFCAGPVFGSWSPPVTSRGPHSEDPYNASAKLFRIQCSRSEDDNARAFGRYSSSQECVWWKPAISAAWVPFRKKGLPGLKVPSLGVVASHHAPAASAVFTP